MATSDARVLSDMPIPPGEILEEEQLKPVKMTQKELAARLGRPAQAINEIIKAKKAITPRTAIASARCWGSAPSSGCPLKPTTAWLWR